MAYQQTLSASESLYGSFLLRRTLLEHKQDALQKGVLLPDDFIASVESFAERNIIHINKKSYKEVCPRCLKAFIGEAAIAHGLPQEGKTLLDSLFPEEAGHNGYYLDNDEVKKVVQTV